MLLSGYSKIIHTYNQIFMEEQSGAKRPRSRVKQKPKTVLYVALLLVALFIAGFYYFVQNRSNGQGDVVSQTAFSNKGPVSTQHRSPAPPGVPMDPASDNVQTALAPKSVPSGAPATSTTSRKQTQDAASSLPRHEIDQTLATPRQHTAESALISAATTNTAYTQEQTEDTQPQETVSTIPAETSSHWKHEEQSTAGQKQKRLTTINEQLSADNSPLTAANQPLTARSQLNTGSYTTAPPITDLAPDSNSSERVKPQYLASGPLRPDAPIDKVQRLINELNAFYAHLDRQPYMQAFDLKTPSKVHFSRLLQKLLENPPVISRETDDLFTLLKNTAHFFRVLGKDNIIILKGILDREKDSLERILRTFHALTFYPEALFKEYNITLSSDRLYEYGGFFLNTMGGRLYLFRRDSNSRMVVSYYAILVIDQARSEGNDRLGINLLPAIDSLIEEIENGGRRLTYREDYLDSLYDLKEQYGSRM